MKNKETGEFELLVGNGQIISGFFILALLLAVFFAMGFIVARAKYQQEPATATTVASTPPADGRGSAAAPATPPPTPLADDAKPPANDQTQAETPPAQAAKPEKAEPPPAEQVVGETAKGAYWQVSSISNQDAARALQQTIKDMGLPVTLGQGPNNLIRVLVGPYSDTATMAHVKTQLENAGLQPVKHNQ
jgi:cell division septation protein DedD